MHIASRNECLQKSFDETKYLTFLIKNDKFFEKYNEILEIVSNSIKKEFDRQPIYNEKYLKNKLRSYEGKLHTNTHDDKIPKWMFSMCFFISNNDWLSL